MRLIWISGSPFWDHCVPVELRAVPSALSLSITILWSNDPQYSDDRYFNFQFFFTQNHISGLL